MTFDAKAAFNSLLADVLSARDSLDSALLIDAVDDRRRVLGELKGTEPLSYVEVASQIGSHSAVFSRLKSGTLPGEKTLARLFSWLGVSDLSPFVLTGNESLPVAGLDAEWDAAAAAGRVFELYTDPDSGEVDVDGVSQAFLWRDDEADTQTPEAYTFGFADVVDGALTIIPAGVEALGAVTEEDLQEPVCGLFEAVTAVHADFPECPFAAEDTGDGDPAEEGPVVVVASTQPAGHSGPIGGAVQVVAFGGGGGSDGSATTLGGGGCGCAEHDLAAADAAEEPSPASEDGRTAAIFGTGRMSESEDPDTQALVTRAIELMLEGAAGVSIKHDMDPADMPDPAVIDELMAAEKWDELDALLADVHARPRHVALVDTAAFSDSRLTYNEETGEVSGPVAYEGHWTGDIRRLPYGVLTWDEDLLPIPITMGHEGPGGTQPPIIGYISTLERQDGVTAALLPLPLDEQAVTAAAGGLVLPAKYFAKFKATKPMPVHVDAPDANGMRRIWGHAAPKGVCHRSQGMGVCFQYPDDVDKNMGYFHTGAQITLDDGSNIRVGALTSGGLHRDLQTAQQRGFSVHELNRHREDTTQTLAMIHAWPDIHGLAFSGVIAANVDEHRLMQALAGAPSVELWPAGRGRTLVGIHVVPTPAWPIVASVGEAMFMTTPVPIEVDEPPTPLTASGGSAGDPAVPVYQTFNMGDPEEVITRLIRIESALALLITDRVADGIPEPVE